MPTTLERARMMIDAPIDDDGARYASALALVSIAESLDRLTQPQPAEDTHAVMSQVGLVIHQLERARDQATAASSDDSLNGDLAAARAVAYQYAIKALEGITP